MRCVAPALLAAATLLAVAVQPAAAAPRCKVGGLALERKSGSTRAQLTWRTPRGVPAGARFRVVRDRRVLGQTRRTAMRVRVSLNRRHRFTVIMLQRSGRRAGCSARRAIRVGYRVPGRPQHIAAGGASGAAVELSWQPATRGDAPVTGYRVFRDGAVFKQTRARSIAVPISSKRSYRFAVAAVDRRGIVGSRSETVTLVTGHTAPPTPAGLAATVMDARTVALAWQPSSPARGRLAGYRIFRDGTPVGQVKDTSARMENLFAARSYSFSIAAVDTLGYVSAPSMAVNVTTAAPEPTRGNLHAFLLASTGRSFEDFQAHYRQIGTVYPTLYDCDLTTAALTGRHDELVTTWAQARRVRVLPRFNCQRGALLHRILTDAPLREQWLSRIVSLVDEHGYDGAALDFEAGFAADRAFYTAFVAELAARLHARGKSLSLAVSAKTRDVANHPRSTFFDYLGLSEHADTMFVMAWGIHWATSAPGAQDALPWVAAVADYVATMPRRERFVMGTMLYAMDWGVPRLPGEEAEVYEYEEAVARAARVGATIRHDPVADALTFRYEAADGRTREVWFPEATTVASRVRIARDRGLGSGFWRLGREDQRLWDHALLAP